MKRKAFHLRAHLIYEKGKKKSQYPYPFPSNLDIYFSHHSNSGLRKASNQMKCCPKGGPIPSMVRMV